MDDITLFQFAIGFALCVIFSAFSVGFMTAKKPNWELLIGFNLMATIAWFTFGVLNASLATDAQFVPYSWLYMGLGLIFMLFAVISVVKLLMASGKPTSISLAETD
jgi:hypothetical protein